MTQYVRRKVFFYAITIIFIIGAVLDLVINRDASLLILLGVAVFLLAFDFVFLGKWQRFFRKMMNALPADHKLISTNLSVMEIGYYRFIYRVYEKSIAGKSKSKTHISMMVGIPFPSIDDSADHSSDTESIKLELQGIIDSLQKDELLTWFYPIVSDSHESDDGNEEDEDKEQTTWLEQLFYLEFPLRKVTSSLLTDIQNKILALTGKYGIQDITWCTVTDYNNEADKYKLYRGNILQSTVIVKNKYHNFRFDYKQNSQFKINSLESRCSIDDYMLHYNTAQPCHQIDSHISLKNLERTIKQVFEGKHDCQVQINDTRLSFNVHITVPELRKASIYHLIASDGYWWFFAEGLLDNIDSCTFDDESTACSYFLSLLTKYAL
ncbi:MAG: hypothetical protein IKS24_09650 [Bacteroidaceae bacterium]|nr:hypothetical protein [Bacteroidaceae bacterium]